MKKLFNHIAPSAFHNSADRYDPPKCHPHTRKAIIQKIMDWAQDPQNLHLLMWIYGPAGSGKSAIMQTIAELSEEAGILAGSFFFFRTGEKRNIKTHLITTLAYQLAVKDPSFYEHITLAIHHDPSIFSQNLDTQMKVLITDPLKSICAAHPHVNMLRFIVLVDGLDECGPEDSHREIITVLFKSARSPFRFITASRPEYVIRTTFSLPFAVEKTGMLALDDNYQADDDIRLFLRNKFTELRSKHPRGRDLPPLWPTYTDINTLVRNASGQFIYASTVMKFLDLPRHDPITALDTVLHTQLSTDQSHAPFVQLDALYHHVLGTVQDITKVLKILHYILLVDGPKDLDYIEVFLGYSNGESRTVLCDMHSLLDVPENGAAEIRFYHTSLGDFLRDSLRARHLFIPPSNSHASISACFAQNIGGTLLVS